MKEGTSALPFFHTYPRSWIVCMIEAKVEGRPMPSSSRRATRLGSVYRDGGLVVCPLASSSRASSCCPRSRRGSRRSASSVPGSSSPSFDAPSSRDST